MHTGTDRTEPAPQQRLGEKPGRSSGKRASSPRVHALHFRVPIQTFKLIHDLAAASGNSVSREIERRVAQSAAEDDLLGGPQVADFFREMATRARETAGPVDWFADADTLAPIASLWTKMIAAKVAELGRIEKLISPSSIAKQLEEIRPLLDDEEDSYAAIETVITAAEDLSRYVKRLGDRYKRAQQAISEASTPSTGGKPPEPIITGKKRKRA
jgi:hypothetical protein